MKSILKQAAAELRKELKPRHWAALYVIFVVAAVAGLYVDAVMAGLSPAVYAIKLVSGIWLLYLFLTGIYGMLLGCFRVAVKWGFIDTRTALVRATAIYLGMLALTPAVPITAAILYFLPA